MKNINIFCLFILLSVCFGAQFDSQLYYDLYADYKLAPDDLMQMTPHLVGEKVKELAEKYPLLKLDEAGKSIEGRPLYHLAFGDGKTTLLLWSQMHGDEPTATAALLALFKYFGEQADDPFVSLLRERLAIHVLIMLNPDGAERFQRRNAQDIDINRDARLLQSPEGQTLKRLKESLNPQYGFNLHDMGGRETVGKDKKLLNMAFMAPPFDEENRDSPNRLKAKKLVVIMKEALDPFISGHIARYKADYMPRAFGDAMQNWGVSTVLIESGMHDEKDPHHIVRMNFIALLRAFDAIATGAVENADLQVYEEIPLEGADLFDILIRDALILNGSDMPPFRGDIGINIMHRKDEGQIVTSGKITDLGDLSVTTGRHILEGDNLVVTPAFIGMHDDSVMTDIQVSSGFTKVFSKLKLAEKGLSPVTVKAFTTAWMIEAGEVPGYTSIPSKNLEMKHIGLIRRGYRADLNVFEDEDPRRLESSNLRYVLLNGMLNTIKNSR